MQTEMPLNAVIVPVTAYQQNCTLLWCTKTMRGAFVDPGGDIARLKAIAQDRGVTVEKILVTHGHGDHCGMVAQLAEDLGVPIEGPHRDDLFWIERLTEAGPRMGMTGTRPFTPDRWLENGDTVTVGELTLNVIHCPGHTPGHVVFHSPDVRLALVGDVLFQGSIGRTDFPKGDHETLIRSIVERLWPLGPETAFVPGHGPMSSFGRERQTNPFVADQVLSRGLPGAVTHGPG
ncbi:MAG: MBL fold metallo-hydrolase [Alphaproteobacteria bacterium]|nr:MBL fold metallo-hydrolase [Alphaproteobacteria bacterium]